MRVCPRTEKRKVGQRTARDATSRLACTMRRAFAAPTVTRFLLCLLFAALVITSRLIAQEPEASMNADRFETDGATGDLVMTGNARIDDRGIFLKADQIRYNPKTLVATARGNVELTRGPRRLLADEIVYRRQDRTFNITRVRMGEHPLYVSGREASGTLENIRLTDATVTYQEPRYSGLVMKAQSMAYQPTKLFRAEKVKMGVGPVLPFRSPVLQREFNRQSLLSYLDAHAGYRGDLGAFMGVGVLLPVTPHVDVGTNVSLYTKRGYLITPTAAYSAGTEDRAITGNVKGGYISDYGPRLNDILGRPIEERRSFFEWAHRQQVTETITVNGQFAYWSDSAVIRDFRPMEFYPVQQPDTFLEGTQVGTNHVVSLFTRAQPNSYFRVQQRLPELRYDLLPSALSHGVFHQFQASAAVLREDALLTGPTLNSTRFDTYYGLERPITPRDWFTLTPVAGARVTHYARATGGKSDYTRVLGEVGLDAELRASAVFAYKSEQWKIDGIRHLVTPRLSYRYIPEATKGRAYIPPIDDRVFSTYLQPLGLGEQRPIDDLHGTNVIRLGVDNTFQTRARDYGSRDLLRVNFATDFLQNTAPGEKDFSAIHTDLAFTPAPWIEFNLYQSTTPQDFKLRELNTGFTLRDGDVWSFHFANHFLRKNIEEYISQVSYRFNERFLTYARFHYDSRQKRLTEQSYGVIQNIDNLWTVSYGIAVFDGARREGRFGFNIQVTLLGF